MLIKGIGQEWGSPDGKIKKTVVSVGDFNFKPSEGSVCKIRLVEGDNIVEQFLNLTIGDTDSDLGRLVEICVSSMYEKEISEFTLNLEAPVKFTFELEELQFKGFIYEWDAKQKFDYANFQKNQGKHLFTKGEICEAGFRYNKALKILASIPISVSNRPTEIDSVKIVDIELLKAQLFNNLAACFFKKQEWLTVIEMCGRVLKVDPENSKANYKLGVAFLKEGNYENAEKCLVKVLNIEPKNKAVLENLEFVRNKLKESNEKCDLMVKKMFSSISKA